MTKEKRVKLLEKAMKLLKDANEGQPLDSDKFAVARAHDAVMNARNLIERGY